ncbi:hypothetical protein [uncultured Reyranella sp.]|uniref:hypothetical protein n=1 Tax=uncultured Reyranella sp. TaxID=735512 RepID=UPI00259CE3C1|nr:hypothetical protein [uncultured Reyranella sp.]
MSKTLRAGADCGFASVISLQPWSRAQTGIEPDQNGHNRSNQVNAAGADVASKSACVCASRVGDILVGRTHMIFDVPAFLRGLDIVVKDRGDFILRRLFPSDFDCLLSFRENIVNSIGDPDILRLMPDEHSFVEAALNMGNFAIGLFDDRRMVAFNSQFWPSTDEDLHELHIYDCVRRRASASKITFAGGIMVDPEFRGGLQKFLMEVRSTVASHVGRRHHISTVSFANPFSWRNIMEMGGRMIAIYEFDDPRYGHTSRMLMHASPKPKSLADDAIWVQSMDIEGQRVVLGRGMVGAAFRKAGSGFEIAYQTELN